MNSYQPTSMSSRTCVVSLVASINGRGWSPVQMCGQSGLELVSAGGVCGADCDGVGDDAFVADGLAWSLGREEAVADVRNRSRGIRRINDGMGFLIDRPPSVHVADL